jgi:hypothetical protein
MRFHKTQIIHLSRIVRTIKVTPSKVGYMDVYVIGIYSYIYSLSSAVIKKILFKRLMPCGFDRMASFFT